MRPGNDLQDVSFNQQLLGTQIGLSFAKEVGGAASRSARCLAYGQAKAKLEANKSSSTGNGWAYGVNGTVRVGGFYVDAVWQKLAMDVDFSTPEALSSADGKTNAKGSGFNVEAGYAYKLKSGLTFAPQLQYATVKVDLDDVASSDGVYALTEDRRQGIAAAGRRDDLQELRNGERLGHAARVLVLRQLRRVPATATCCRTALISPTTPRARASRPSSA